MSDVFRFFDLPPELRNEIYKLVLTFPGTLCVKHFSACGNQCVHRGYNLTPPDFQACTSLLYTSRQQNYEASAVLYANRMRFSFVTGLNCFLNEIGSQRRHLRAIEVTHVTFYHPRVSIDPRLVEAKNFVELTLCHFLYRDLGSPSRNPWKTSEWWILIRSWATSLKKIKGTREAISDVLNIVGYNNIDNDHNNRDPKDDPFAEPYEVTSIEELERMMDIEFSTKAKLRSHTRPLKSEATTRAAETSSRIILVDGVRVTISVKDILHLNRRYYVGLSTAKDVQQSIGGDVYRHMRYHRFN